MGEGGGGGDQGTIGFMLTLIRIGKGENDLFMVEG